MANEAGSEPQEDADEDAPSPPSHRAPALLAVVRIVAVLGMSFFIAFGLFLLLLPSWIPAVLSFIAAVPFFFMMRFFERFADADDPSHDA